MSLRAQRLFLWFALFLILLLFLPGFEHFPDLLVLMAAELVVGSLLIYNVAKDLAIIDTVALNRWTTSAMISFSICCLLGSDQSTTTWRGHQVWSVEAMLAWSIAEPVLFIWGASLDFGNSCTSEMRA